MPSVTVWLFPTAFGAETGEAHLTGLVERGALVVHDAAAISWVPSDPELLSWLRTEEWIAPDEGWRERARSHRLTSKAPSAIL